MDRRAFIQGAAIVAVAPILANVAAFATPVQLNSAPATPKAAAGSVVSPIELRVRGWHRGGDIAFDQRAAPSAVRTNDSLDNEQVLISVNQTWRSAWR
jgi:hypothetical protein